MKAIDALAGLASRLGIKAESDGQKCEVAYLEDYRPYGGAQSFNEIEQYLAASEVEARIRDLSWQFDAIVSNIMADDDEALADKAGRVEEAARQLRTRVVTDIRGPMEGLAADVKARGLDGAFKSFDVPGGPYWAGIWSNNRQDRQADTLALEGIREYVETANKADYRPELLIWHVPGSRIGETLLMDVTDEGMAFAFGRYDNAEYADTIAAWPEDLGMSHGMVYQKSDKQDDGTIERFITYELSLVPLRYAANGLTAHQAIKAGDSPMALNTETVGMLKGILGDGRTKAIEDMIADSERRAVASGLQTKAADEPTEPMPEAPAEGEPVTAEAIAEIVAKALEPYNATLATLADVVMAMKAATDEQAAVIEDLQLEAEEKAAQLATPRNVRSLAAAGRGPARRSADATKAREEIEAGIKAAQSGTAASIPEHLRPYMQPQVVGE